MTLSIRARLTVWYSVLLAFVLILFGGGVLSLHDHWGRARFDAELLSISVTVSRVVQEEMGESGNVQRAIAEAQRSIDIPGWATAILDATGQPVSAHWSGFPYREHATAPLGADSQRFASVNDGGRTWRVLVTRTTSSSGDYLIFVGALDQVARESQLLLRTLLVATPLVVVLAAGVCWLVASWALRPVTAMAAEAEAVTARSLTRRLSAGTVADELGQLARAFNRLLDRLASALQTQQQFMADASHELRTPVSVVRTTADVTLGRPVRDEAEYRDALTIVREQSVRLGRMVEDILVLARADAGGYPALRRPLYLDDLVADCVETMAVLARPRGVRLTTDASPGVLTVADAGLLQQLVTNLVQNAIQHTPKGGSVHLSLESRGSIATIAVADTGCGIPPDARARIFDRFVRLDPARGSSAGAGLGLPIARWIAELHGGTLSVIDNAAGGCTFVIRLPLEEMGTAVPGADA